MAEPKILSGRETAKEIRQEIAAEVARRKEGGLKVPHLAAVLVGNDGGSETYVSYKVKDCKEVGFDSTLIRRNDDVTEEELLKLIAELNANDDIDGFIVQLPLPKHIDSQKVITAIDPDKDVDGFHPTNVGRMNLGLDGFLPATPSGIIELLRRNDIETSGKHCVILGRSNIVGSPMSVLLSRNRAMGNATVTLCHSRTKDLPHWTRQADILVAALGRPGFVTADMVKRGAVVIDVGTTRVPDASKKSGFALKGDVLYDEVTPLSEAITPVPGGVGPMTRVALLLNTLKAAKKSED
ncbi:bifunctional 5,10-methylene-tetrahydrofolate dehydrogenase/5,10-methylene-tetrahydrofolate cyclohydrolase [Cryomorphaceae bacterium 1068]|nr:bifunctional 5,10-methylene-tetrahydrofolate dehydrogenase/5,10-methylene-tetrahydrofolate cyclohydrolase [Cryomorphaceae bacterium 1068]